MFSWNLLEHDTLPSTQSHAVEQFKKNAILSGDVIFTQRQTSGVGRHGREWKAGEGNAFFSFLIKAPFKQKNLGQMALFSGLAIAQCLDALADLNANITLKWPNDVLLDGKKCAGILVQSLGSDPQDDEQSILIGIGLNVMSAPLDYASCLGDFMSKPPVSRDVAMAILRRFDALCEIYISDGFSGLLREQWLEYSFDIGAKVSVKIGSDHITGLFQGIDTLGCLVLICDKTGERRAVASGDVFFS